MPTELSQALDRLESTCSDPRAVQFAFGLECAQRVRHFLEDRSVVRCLDTLAAYVHGQAGPQELEQAATEAAALANKHQGSRSLDGVGHAAVSASYAVACALAGKAAQAAEYAAYASVYGGGGYGATSELQSFLPEHAWQLATLERLVQALGRKEGAA